MLSAVSKGPLDVFVGVPTTLDQQYGLACLLDRLLQGLVHRQRVSLGVKGEPTGKEHDQGICPNSKLLSGGLTLIWSEGKIAGVNPKRNDWQPRQDEALGPKVLPEVLLLSCEQTLYVILDRGRGADQRIPGLNRSRQ